MEGLGVANVLIHAGYSSRFKATICSCPVFNCKPGMGVPGFMAWRIRVVEMHRLELCKIVLERRCIVESNGLWKMIE
jgi:hypothetical protein